MVREMAKEYLLVGEGLSASKNVVWQGLLVLTSCVSLAPKETAIGHLCMEADGKCCRFSPIGFLPGI